MTEQQSEHPIKVTAEQRRHSAIRALARACIALARWQRENDKSTSSSTPKPAEKPPTTAVDQPKEAGDA